VLGGRCERRARKVERRPEPQRVVRAWVSRLGGEVSWGGVVGMVGKGGLGRGWGGGRRGVRCEGFVDLLVQVFG